MSWYSVMAQYEVIVVDAQPAYVELVDIAPARTRWAPAALDARIEFLESLNKNLDLDAEASLRNIRAIAELTFCRKLVANGGHPVLRWNASTVMAETDNSPAENIKPTKPKTKSGARRIDDNKIDGIVALAMALAVYLAADPDMGPCVYEERGLLTL